MAAAPDRERHARQTGLELAAGRRGHAAPGVAVGVGDQQHDLRAVVAGRGADRPRRDRPRAARRDREQPPAPVILARVARVSAYDDDAAARRQVACPAPCLARSDRRGRRCGRRAPPAESSSAASSDARSGARTRSTSDAISVVTSRNIVWSGACSRARMRRRPTDASATLSSIVVTSSASRISDRSSAGERAATASTAAERSIRTRLASSTRAAVRRISGRPAPASTASVISASAAKSGTPVEVAAWRGESSAISAGSGVVDG